MKASIFLLSVCFFITSTLVGQQQELRMLTSFNKIHFEGQGSIYLEQGDETKVNVQTNTYEQLSSVITEIRGETLYIWYNLDNPGHPVFAQPRMDIYLTYQELDGMTLKGHVKVDAYDPLIGNELSIAAEGYIDMDLNLNVSHLDASAEGHIDMIFTGQTNSQNIQLEGQGSINAFNLSSDDTVATVDGTGTIFVFVNKALEAAASGLSKIIYKGNPAKKVIDKTGMVTIKRKQI